MRETQTQSVALVVSLLMRLRAGLCSESVTIYNLDYSSLALIKGLCPGNERATMRVRDNMENGEAAMS